MCAKLRGLKKNTLCSRIEVILLAKYVIEKIIVLLMRVSLQLIWYGFVYSDPFLTCRCCSNSCTTLWQVQDHYAKYLAVAQPSS